MNIEYPSINLNLTDEINEIYTVILSFKEKIKKIEETQIYLEKKINLIHGLFKQDRKNNKEIDYINSILEIEKLRNIESKLKKFNNMYNNINSINRKFEKQYKFNNVLNSRLNELENTRSKHPPGFDPL